MVTKASSFPDLYAWPRGSRPSKARGTRYLVGSSLTAVDIYWAVSAGMIEPLPEELCAMGALFRDVYTVQDPVIEKAAVPILMRHRDFIYERHLELPIDLKT